MVFIVLQKVAQLQRMIRNQALLAGSLSWGPGLIHNSLNSLVVDVVNVESSGSHNMYIPSRGNRFVSNSYNNLNAVLGDFQKAVCITLIYKCFFNVCVAPKFNYFLATGSVVLLHILYLI